MIFGFNNCLKTTVFLAVKWNVEFFCEYSHTGVYHVPVHVDSAEEATSLPSDCKRRSAMQHTGVVKGDHITRHHFVLYLVGWVS